MGKGKKEDAPLTQLDQPKLQAIILADSFITTFQPISLDLPKVLCPLNNIPLLNYTMDCLAGNGVEQVFVVCTNDQVEEHLMKKQATWQGKLMSVECVKDTSLTNAGDALRELYKRNVIQSDPFLLVFGDIVTNIDLRPALEAHKERHENDSAAIMTLCLAPTAHSPIQSAKDDLVVGLDPSQSNRVLLYDNHSSKSSVRLPCSFFAAHPGMEVRTDLMDTGIFICSPDVLGRFEDEFDYLNITQDFVTNCVAEEEEGLQTRIHAHILQKKGDYAARIVDWATYHAVSRDLLQRWCYPMVADNMHDGSTMYTLRKSYLYKEIKRPSTLARSAKVEGPGMLGSNGQIHPHAIIEATVLGQSVSVASHACVQDSHIWNGVSIEEGAKVKQSVIAHDAVIKKNAIVSKCIIGPGCIIGEGIKLPEYTRITLQEGEVDPFADDEDGDWSKKNEEEAVMNSSDIPTSQSDNDVAIVGSDGKGHVWQHSLEDDDDDDDNESQSVGNDETLEGLFSNLRLQSIGTNLKPYFSKRLHRQSEPQIDGFSDDEGADGLEEAFTAYTEGAFTFSNTAGDGPSTGFGSAQTMVVGRQKGVDVIHELKEICMEYEDNGSMPMENLAIELNSYKFSQNASYSDCTMASALAIIEKMNISTETTDGKLVAGIKQKMEFWAPLLQKMSIGQPEELAIIHGLEQAATATEGKSSVLTPTAEKLSTGLSFRFILQTMHDEEVLNEETLLAWAESRKSEAADSPVGKLFHLPSVQAFLEWLEEEDDDDSDDESSNGDDSDE